jgi:hypothetical protein
VYFVELGRLRQFPALERGNAARFVPDVAAAVCEVHDNPIGRSVVSDGAVVPAFRYWLDNMGDETIVAWVCAGVLFLAGACSWREFLRSQVRSPERALWASLGVLLFSIGLNKQLDLQILAVKGLGALFGHQRFWVSRRLVAVAVLGAFGTAVVGLAVVLGRAVPARAFPLKVATGAGAALASLALARGTTGVVNELLVTDLYGTARISQIQVKDALELGAAAAIVVSCLRWRRIESRATDPR